MGLDITAYKNIKKIGTAKDYDEYEESYDWNETAYACRGYVDDGDFPGWSDGLESEAVYKYEDEMGFRAGSYSGYNEWRAMLSAMALGVRPETVWANEDTYTNKPFFRLICFSDCEGFIGPVHAKKLAQDFADFQAKADEHPDWWFRDRYADWRKASEYAANNGFIHFH